MKPPPDPPCVLVVDDDPPTARLLEVAFRPTRAKVVTHHRAFGVLDAVAVHRPVVVVLDVMMPGLDGPSLVELLRADCQLAKTRVVLWSALDLDDLTRRGERCGADGVLEKVRGPRAAVDQICAWLLDWDALDLR